MKEETLRHIGSMEQLAFIRSMEYTDARACGLRAYDVQNGLLHFTVLADKCLDIADFTYRGMNIHFLSKPGLQGRNHYDTNGNEAQRSIMGGMLFTCGLENICAPCNLEGKEYPMHGRIRTTPAKHLCADASWEQESYKLSIQGEMREAELFGENLVLRRKISTHYGEKSILIEDEIENQSFREEPMMLLYHFNIGYPMLSESSKVYLPVKATTARDPHSHEGIHNWNQMGFPEDQADEQVFIHQLYCDENQNTLALLVNKEKELGVCYDFNQRYLPYFHQWKSTASGDYVMGFEPANSSIYGKQYHHKEHTTHMLKPFEKESIKIKIAILDGQQEIDCCKQKIKLLKGESE